MDIATCGVVFAGRTRPASADPFETLPDAETRGAGIHASVKVESEFEQGFRSQRLVHGIRVLSQEVDRFEQTCCEAACQIATEYPHLPIGVEKERLHEWVAAKMVGRWKNGSSLIANPVQEGSLGEQDYRMAFGRDDPRGLQCPFGSRARSNPRDSLLPGDEQEMDIVNRRLLRRRRSSVTEKRACSSSPFARIWKGNSSSSAKLDQFVELPCAGRRKRPWLPRTERPEFTIPLTWWRHVMKDLVHLPFWLFRVPSRSALLFLCSF